MSPKKYFFILDVDSIQKYIFNTNRLKTIVGASALLDYINANNDGETLAFLKGSKYGFTTNGSIDEIKKSLNFIYSAGGATQVIFPTEKLAYDFQSRIKKIIIVVTFR
ncbi:MAG: hypothetical protein SWO11_12100 [Thermodesulfobacteriota bacterium]|nr:hypothetical protein [Thermodesulfobacteriota bacterium]